MDSNLELLDKIRRNLLLSSVLLTIYYLAGATILPDSQVTPGIGLKVRRPEYVLYFIWVAHFYFLVRFWVHCNAQRIGWTLNFDRAFASSPAGQALLAKHGGIRTGDESYPRLRRHRLIGRRLEFHRQGTGDTVHRERVRYRDVWRDEVKVAFSTLGNYQGIDVLLPNFVALAPIVAFIVHRSGLL